MSKDFVDQIIDIDGRKPMKMRQMTVMAVRHTNTHWTGRILVDLDRGDGTAITNIPVADGVFPAIGEGVWVTSMGKGRWLCTSTVSTPRVGSGENLFDNGEFRVTQREYDRKSFTFTLPTSQHSYGLDRGADRWSHINQSGATATVMPSSQDSTFPMEWYSSVVAATTVSPAAGAYYLIRQQLEVHQVGQLNWGTSTAQPFTVSFWAMTTVPGTYICEFENGPWRCSRSFTLSTSAVWQKVIVTFPPDTANGFTTADVYDNQFGLSFNLWLIAGSTFNAGGSLNTSWTNNPTSSRAYGCANLFGTSGGVFYCGQMKMEVGSAATPYQFQSYQEQLVRCYRYYKRYHAYGSDGYTPFAPALGLGGGQAMAVFQFPVTMRTTPTLFYGGSIRATDEATSWPTTALALNSHSFGGNLGYVNSTSSTGTWGLRSALVITQNNDHTAYLAFSAD